MVRLHGNLGKSSISKEAIEVNRPRIGIWNVITDSILIESIASEVDFIILDLEHGFRDFKDFKSNFRSAQRHSREVYVRVRRYDDPWLQSLLDVGVTNFIVPQIRSVGEFQSFVKATSFPPHGTRGTHPRFESYLRRNISPHNTGDIKRCLIIETKEAVEELEDLCELTEVNEIYLGTFDLSVEYGINQNTQVESLISLLTHVFNVAQKHEKPLISMLANNELETFYASIEFQGRVIGIDETILTEEVRKLVKRLIPEVRD
jgi:4-hydroxy-2-oxoheptanedioate aldolase